MNKLKVVAGLWSLCQVAWAGPVDAWDFRDQVHDPAWSWTAPERLELPEARLRVQQFSAPLEAEQAARALTRLPGQFFSRLQLSGSVIWLTGLSGPVHWLAKLHGRPGATEGEISSLEPRERFSSRFDALSLAPAGARAVIQVPAPHPGGMSLYRLQVDGEMGVVLSQVARRLSAQHWKPDDEPASNSDHAFATEWRGPDGARLSIFRESDADHVFLTFWHRAEVSR